MRTKVRNGKTFTWSSSLNFNNLTESTTLQTSRILPWHCNLHGRVWTTNKERFSYDTVTITNKQNETENDFRERRQSKRTASFLALLRHSIAFQFSDWSIARKLSLYRPFWVWTGGLEFGALANCTTGVFWGRYHSVNSNYVVAQETGSNFIAKTIP